MQGRKAEKLLHCKEALQIKSDHMGDEKYFIFLVTDGNVPAFLLVMC